MNEVDDQQQNDHGIRDIVTVFVLSITAVLTAWCGFESSKWGGEMSIAFSEASSARVRANDFSSQVRDARQVDVSIYSQWVGATAEEKPGLADYVAARFSPALSTAFDAWTVDGRAERSPFERAEYQPTGTKEAQEWNATADARFKDALVSNQRGDNYSLLTVIFALVLFFTAMSQRNKSERMSRTLLGTAIVLAIGSLTLMLTFPIKI